MRDNNQILTEIFKRNNEGSNPIEGDLCTASNKTWQYDGTEWRNTNYINDVLDSKDVHIRYLESLLKKAIEFKISKKKDHDITVCRRKNKNSPPFYVIKKGLNYYITRDMTEVYDYATYAAQLKDEIRENGFYYSLLDAISYAEKYVDILDAKEDNEDGK